MILKFNNAEKELSEGFRLTTNNRMELLAVIKGLEAIKKSGIPITIYSDSKYVVEAVEKGWLWNWGEEKFQRQGQCRFVVALLSIAQKAKSEFVWIKGHAGHTENERCDVLAVQAASEKKTIDRS